jgi:hypothetical protein
MDSAVYCTPYSPSARCLTSTPQRVLPPCPPPPASLTLALSKAGPSDLSHLSPSPPITTAHCLQEPHSYFCCTPPPPSSLPPSPPLTQALSKAGASDLSQLLEYHVLPEMRPVPTGWKNDATVSTLLKGNTLKSQLSTR